MKKLVLSVIVLAMVGGLVYVLIPTGEDAAEQLDRASANQAKKVSQVEVSGDNSTRELSTRNTKIQFACTKQLAGKNVTVQGGWSNSFGSILAGHALIDSEAESILQIEMQIDIATLWSEHDQLTEALLTKGFFQVEEHPQATFISSSIQEGAPEGSAQSDATHRVEGNLALNGVERSISFPANIEWTDSGPKLHSTLSLGRKDFNVHFTDTAGFGLLTDENISPLVALEVTIDLTAEEQLATVVESNGEGQHSRPTGSPDLADIPPEFTETIPATQIQFDMVLVPGDAKNNSPPLYVGKFEVTWDEFMPWVDGRDLEVPDSLGELRAMKLRPSPPYGSVDRGFGMDRRPALGMSRLAAELYCQWLSQQTGKVYRLPTEQEWERIYQLGGGNLETPPTASDAERLAVYSDNSYNDDIDDWATKQIGSTAPNTLGIHDLAGSVCEWVVGTDEQRVARGGHFDSERDELGIGRHVEDANWNRDYPNEPKSIWWFVNARWVGFRVVAEVPGE